MILADPGKPYREWEALYRQQLACNDAYETHHSALADVAKLDRELVASLECGKESFSRMTDTVVGIGRLLMEELLLRAQLEHLCGNSPFQLPADSAGQAQDQQSSLAAIVQEGTNQDERARHFVSDCSRRLELCLDWLSDSLSEDDAPSAAFFCQQARRIASAMREVQNAWPWVNQEAIAESWRQYQRGELMDFETFKHELLKAAK